MKKATALYPPGERVYKLSASALEASPHSVSAVSSDWSPRAYYWLLCARILVCVKETWPDWVRSSVVEHSSVVGAPTQCAESFGFYLRH